MKWLALPVTLPGSLVIAVSEVRLVVASQIALIEAMLTQLMIQTCHVEEAVSASSQSEQDLLFGVLMRLGFLPSQHRQKMDWTCVEYWG